MSTTLLLPAALDLLVKSSAILLLAFAIDSLWRRASAAQLCLVWVATFAVLLLLPLTLLVTPRWSFALEKAQAPTLPLETPVILFEESSPTTAEQPVRTAAPAVQASPHFSVAQVAFGLWTAGVLSILGRRVLGAFQIRWLRLRSNPLSDARASQLVHRMAHELGLHRRIRLHESAQVSVPLTWGIFSPVLLLPRQALTWDDQFLESALRHELGHIRHRDALARLLATVVCAFYWPNMLVWLAAKAWRTAQEQACDDLVLRAGASTQGYAMQLLEAARCVQSGILRHAPVLAMASPSMLERRLSAIMDDTRDRRPLGRGAWFAGIGSGLILLMTCAALQVRAQEKDKNRAPALPDGDPPAQVELRARIFEAPAGTLRTVGFAQDAAKVHHGVQGVLTSGQIGDCILRLQGAPDTRLLSAPSILTLSGQKATVETGRDGRLAPKDKDGAEFEGFRLGIEPTLSPDHKLVEVNVAFTVCESSGVTRDGKPDFKELRLTPCVNMYTGCTLVLRGDHPADDKREVVVLLTAGVPAKNKAKADVDAPKDNATPVPAEKLKAQRIVLPRVRFQDATLEEALDFLRVQAKNLDPANEGVNIVLVDPATGNERITMDVTEIALSEALKYVAEVAARSVGYEEHAVRIIKPGLEDALLTRTYQLPKAVMSEVAEAEEWLKKRDVPFPDGASAVLNRSQGLLTVQTTVAVLKNLDDLMDQVGATASRVKVDLGAMTMEADTINMTGKDLEGTGNATVTRMANATKGVKVILKEDGRLYFTKGPSTTMISGALGRAQKIILPKFECKNASVAEAVEFIRVQSRSLDPEKNGVNIRIKTPPDMVLPALTLERKNISVDDALSEVAQQANLRMGIEVDALTLEPR
jgi:beta-lactamase regulating signal transducer with metallopeptidase domain